MGHKVNILALSMCLACPVLQAARVAPATSADPGPLAAIRVELPVHNRWLGSARNEADRFRCSLTETSTLPGMRLELPAVRSQLIRSELQAAYNRNVGNRSAVPLPATAWLFGTALFGLVGIARRRQQS